MANMVVRTNIFSLNAHRNMKNVGAEQQRAANRLASGFRINSAADDAAGLAISESMRAQIRGLDQASRNAQDGQALINTAEGGMQEIQNMLQRIRELTVQAANDTNTAVNRGHIQLEVNQLLEEIDSMAGRVEFNGMQLLTGNFESRAARDAITGLTDPNTFAVGATGDIRMGLLDIARHVTASLFEELDQVQNYAGVNMQFWGVDQDIEDINVHDFLLTADGRIVRVTGFLSPTATSGDDPDDFRSIIEYQSFGTVYDLLHAANFGTTSTDEDLAIAFIVANHDWDGFAAVDDLNEWTWDQAAVSAQDNALFFQVGANSMQSINVSIADMRIASIFAADSGFVGFGMQGDIYQIGQVQGQGGAFRENAELISNLIDRIEQGIEFVSLQRATMGAVSNRLDFTSRSLDISSENLSDAESRVRNTDMAREMMRFTMSNVLQQAAVSMLAQANQLPNNLLQLLR